jgi:hypothetical protein
MVTALFKQTFLLNKRKQTKNKMTGTSLNIQNSIKLNEEIPQGKINMKINQNFKNKEGMTCLY